MNIIFGAGGFAREVAWLMHEMARVDATRGPLDAFVASDDSPDVGCRIHGVEVLADAPPPELVARFSVAGVFARGDTDTPGWGKTILMLLLCLAVGYCSTVNMLAPLDPYAP